MIAGVCLDNLLGQHEHAQVVIMDECHNLVRPTQVYEDCKVAEVLLSNSSKQ